MLQAIIRERYVVVVADVVITAGIRTDKLSIYLSITRKLSRRFFKDAFLFKNKLCGATVYTIIHEFTPEYTGC